MYQILEKDSSHTMKRMAGLPVPVEVLVVIGVRYVAMVYQPVVEVDPLGPYHLCIW